MYQSAEPPVVVTAERQPVPTSHPAAPATTPWAAGNAAVGRLLHRSPSGPVPSVPDGFADRLGPGGGRQLPEDTRTDLEAGFGASLGEVRLHTDASAATLAAQVNARAFTVGRDIYFGQGEYRPESADGRRLLAHEVTHTLQRVTASGPLTVDRPDSPAEREADAIAGTMVSGRANPLGPAGFMALQRSAGNGATSRAVQRWTNPVVSFKSNAELIDAALNEGDVSAAKQIGDVSGLGTDQKLKLIDLLKDKGDSWGRDAGVMLRLWQSFGDAELLTVANGDKGARWKACTKKYSELTLMVRPIVGLRDQFPKDVLALAHATLEGNHKFVQDTMTELGISLDPGITGAQLTDSQQNRMQELQNAAASVARLQAGQEHARQVNVGWRKDTDRGAPPGVVVSTPGADPMPQPGPSATYFIPQTYDPITKPEYIQEPQDAPPLVNVLGKGTVVPYQEVDDKFRASAVLVEFFLGRFPELYAIVRDGKSSDTAAFSAKTDPRAARDQLGAAMHKLLKDIEGTVGKLGGDLDVLDLVPLHTRMTQEGLKPPGGTVNWKEPVQAQTALEVVGDHDFNRALAAIGIELAANALFLIAPFTGAGALFVMLGGVALQGAKAKMSADRAAALTEAAATAAQPGSALVSDTTVDSATKEAEADKVALALTLLQIGVQTAVAGAVQSGTKIAEMETRLTKMLADPLLTEGPHTRGYIDATGPKVKAYESQTIQALGEEFGCHSCGAKDAGQYGTWHGDHQPPTGLVKRGLASGQQILVPHCETCSNKQGFLVRDIVALWNELQLAKGLPGTVPDIVPPPVAPPTPKDQKEK